MVLRLLINATDRFRLQYYYNYRLFKYISTDKYKRDGLTLTAEQLVVQITKLLDY